MAVTRAVLPVDRFLALYNGLLATIWLALADRTPGGLAICFAHGAAVSLPWLLPRARGVSRGTTVLLELYPLIWLGAFWAELDLLRLPLHAHAYDAAITALDGALFGVHLHVIWILSMPWRWFSELMHFSYFAYYALIFLPPVAALLAGRRDALRDMTFRLMVTYVGCYLVYLAFPVDAPASTTPLYAGALVDGFFYQLVHAAHEIGDSLGASFPSSHVAGAVTIALLGRRWFGRWIARLFVLEAVGVTLSTVYTQSHVAVDAVAGLGWALAAQWFVAPALARALGRPVQDPRRTPSRVTPDLVGGTSGGRAA
jgi:membrane-associated phospholipid phosphatase